MLLIPCGHNVCKKCSHGKSSCPVCHCAVSSSACNIMLQQIIHEYQGRVRNIRSRKQSNQSTYSPHKYLETKGIFTCYTHHLNMQRQKGYIVITPHKYSRVIIPYKYSETKSIFNCHTRHTNMQRQKVYLVVILTTQIFGDKRYIQTSYYTNTPKHKVYIVKGQLKENSQTSIYVVKKGYNLFPNCSS